MIAFTPPDLSHKAVVKVGVLAVAAIIGLVAVMGTMRALNGITSSDRANDIFNAAAALPPELIEAVTWEPDAPDLARQMEPLTRDDITEGWLRAWEQLNIVAETGDTSGLEVYFSKSALEATTATATDMAGYSVHQLSHQLRVDFYSLDGQVVGLSAPEVWVARAVPMGDSVGWVTAVESYEAVLLLEDGNFRIQHWVRQDAQTRWWTEPISPGTDLPSDGDDLAISLPVDHVRPSDDQSDAASDLDRIAASGADSVRIFLPFHELGGRRVTSGDLASVLDVLDMAADRGLAAVLTLFDGHTDHGPGQWDADRDHLATVVPALAEHRAVVLWDVKHEPDRDIGANGVNEQLTYTWLGEMAHQIRQLDAANPITVGWSTPDAALAAPVQTDVVSFHYDGPADDLAAFSGAVADHADGRPVLLSE